MIPSSSRCLFCAALLAAVAPARGADWFQFLGPWRDGVCRETGINLDWDKHKPKTVWKVPLGSAFSSVAVVGNRVYTMARRGDKDAAVCLDAATGKEVWARDLAPTFRDKQGHGYGARSTPTVVNGKVYCWLPRGELACLAADDGKELWKTDTLKETGAKDRSGEFYFWGLSASPLVDGEVVIVQPGGKQNGSVAAFHKDTGKKVWSVGDDPSGYASPILITAAGKRQLVCPTGQSVLGIDPEKGKLLWRYPFGNRFDATCATPVWADNLLFVSAAYGVGCAVLEVVTDGDGVKAREKWRNKNLQALFATPMVHEGHVYGCHGDIGAIQVRCLELATGKLKWTERAGGRFMPLLVEKQLLCLGERGNLLLVEANPERYVQKAELDKLLTYKAWPAPVLVNKRLYLRDEKQLLCLDLSRP